MKKKKQPQRSMGYHQIYRHKGNGSPRRRERKWGRVVRILKEIAAENFSHFIKNTKRKIFKTTREKQLSFKRENHFN